MLSTIFFQSITTPFITLAVIQYPVYGVVLGLANRNGHLLRHATALLAIHVLLAAVCLIVPDQNF